MKQSSPRQQSVEKAVDRSDARSHDAGPSLTPPRYGVGLVDDLHAAGEPDVAAAGASVQRAPAARFAARRPPPACITAPVIQARLRVGPVHDAHEREADRIADAVVRRSARPDAAAAPAALGAAVHPLVQRHGDHGAACSCSACVVQRHPGHAHEEDDELHRRITVQRHPGHAHDEDDELHRRITVQRHPGHAHEEDDELHRRITVQRHPGAHHHDEEEEDEDEPRWHAGIAVQRQAHAAGCACPGCCAPVQRRAAGDGSFTASADLSTRVQRLAGQGAPLPDGVRDDMERSFGTDLGGVRVHADAAAGRLSRDLGADAFTHGQHIAFAPGKYDPHGQAGRWLLAHELTHTIQQTGGGGLQRAPAIQRHSTHEHYLLGTLSPDQIASIPKIREQVRVAKAQGKHKPKKKHGALQLDEAELDELIEPEELEYELDLKDEEEAARNEVLHILLTEMTRLAKWKDASVQEQLLKQDLSDEDEDEVLDDDGHYEVPMVWIPTLNDTAVLCSYAELNTLPDMFGDIKDLELQPPEAIIRMLQGVRMRSYLELEKMYYEIGGKREHLKGRPQNPSFKDAIGFTGKQGGLKAIPEYEKATKIDGKFTPANASAALARNACHFAPATWQVWADHHDAARDAAYEAYLLSQKGTRVNNPFEDPKTEDDVKDQAYLTNKALLLNGFGDHFLQDAFAAGHLIDKTRVMQWFFEWVKTDSALQTSNYAMIGAITKQRLGPNPQQVESMKGDVSDKVGLAGITVEDHIRLLMWWRRKALSDREKYQTLNATQLLNLDAPVDAQNRIASANATLEKLVAQGFATETKRKQAGSWYTLKKEHIDVIDPKAKERLYDAKQYGDDADGREKEAEEFYYAAYAKFLDSTYLQLITNFLHDKFCKAGLEVATADNVKIGMIYGDTTMLSAGGQDGVRYSAETAKMSRDAILSILNTGKAAHTLTDIDKRFPRKVAPGWPAKNMTPIPIETWWADLKQECVKAGGLFDQGINRKESTAVKRIKVALSKNEMTMSTLQSLRDAEPAEPSHDVY
jgi:hypothetical protein